jgi:hypothetical protein
VATLATLIKNTAAAATSIQIVKFMTAEWWAMGAPSVMKETIKAEATVNGQ